MEIKTLCRKKRKGRIGEGAVLGRRGDLGTSLPSQWFHRAEEGGALLLRSAVILLTIICGVSLLIGSASAQEDPYKKAKTFVSDLGCVACHRLEEDSTTDIRKLAPDLSYEGDKVRPEWLVGYLMSPYKINPMLQGRMPGFRISEEEAVAITKYLMTLKRGVGVAQKVDDPSNPSSNPGDKNPAAPEGKTLFERFACIACHPAPAGVNVPEMPGRLIVAPDLTKAAARLNPEWMAEWIRNPQGIKPGTLMPQLFAGGGEAADKAVSQLTEFILSLDTDGSPSNFDQIAAKYPDSTVEMGRDLVAGMNCAGCHSIPGIEPINPELDVFAPPLTYAGSLVPEKWIVKLLKEPITVYSPYSQARMPDYRFTDEEIDLLKRYLLSLKVERVIAMGVRRPGDEPISRPDVQNPFEGDPVAMEQGKEMFGRTCSHCHGFTGGGGNGPDLTDDYWKFGGTNVAIFRAIYAGRTQTLMAPFRGSIQANDIWRLMLFIRSQYKGDKKG